MGKKHIIETSQEDLIKQSEKVDQLVNKSSSAKSNKVTDARVYVSSSYNNTIVTLTNAKGDVLSSKSAGAVGFKGAKKATSFAASRVSEAIINVCKKLMVEKIEVYIKGVGAGRESAVRTLVNKGMNVVSIKDITPIPHNGVKPKKVRRV
ncbi:30S ribosomal protein S11 [Candidatus Parcubacteria bacterium]|nr:30S ribosomal protein S11 [Candidatus Parcubacteria bacterium]